MLFSIIGIYLYAIDYYFNGGIERYVSVLIVATIGVIVFLVAGKLLKIFDFLKEIKSLDK
jgi:hypothetical protein